VWSVWLEDLRWKRTWRGSIHRPRLRMGRPTRRDPILPGDRWVRVKNTLAGVSEHDLALINGTIHEVMPRGTASKLRRYLGCEVVGTVTAIGADVVLVRTGDRVVLQNEAVSSCAALGLQPLCHACATGNIALCEHRTLPWQGTGAGWSDEMIVHESQLYPVPVPLTDEDAMLLEPASRAVRAVLQRQPDPGSTALVIGGGTIGQLTLSALHAIAPGVQTTIAVDTQLATDAGKKRNATTIIPLAAESLIQRGAEVTNAQIIHQRKQIAVLGGFDLIFVCHSSSASLDAALRLVRGGGAVVLVTPPTALSLKIDTTAFWRDEAALYSVANPGSEVLPEELAESIGARSSTLALAARLMMKQRLTTDGLITHRIPYHSVREAIALTKDSDRQQVLRVALTFNS
jgi:threonine dehydrogenase-like Zn-dependent dehydrogenase